MRMKMKLTNLFFLLGTFVHICNVYSQEWVQVNGYNAIGRHHPITIGNDNFGYMIAGQSATFSNNLDDVFKYDPINDEWTQIYGYFDDRAADV